MNSTKFLIFILAVLTISACRKDIDGEIETVTIEPNVPILHDSGLGGLVINEDGSPIMAATISYLDFETTTDDNGYFYFENVPINENGTLMTIDKEGYFEGFRFAYQTESNDSYIKTMLIEKKAVDNFSASSGGSVDFGNVTLNFPADAIKFESSGNDFIGNVNVYAHYYDPKGANLAASMPGDLGGVDEEFMSVQLGTYGMMAVELISDKGDPLNLKTGSKATMSMELPDILVANAPGTIPLWSLDEISGLWKEDGSANFIDGKYVGDISHFSFWNCDAPFPLVDLTGQLTTADGFPLSHTLISITIISSSSTARTGWTDIEGYFNGKVPKDQDLLLRVKNECGENIHELNIPALAQDTDLGEIKIQEGEEGRVTGRLVCNGAPISNGYVKIAELSNGDYYIIRTEDDGTFSYSKLFCEEGDLELTGYDLNNFTSSDSVTVVSITNGGNVGAGDIEACEVAVPEWFNYTIDGGQESITFNVEARINLDGLIIRGDNSSYSILANLFNYEVGQTTSPADFYFEGSDGYLTCDQDCQGMDFNFTTIDKFVGGFIVGSYSGVMLEEGNLVQVSGDFRIEIDEYIALAWLEGYVWNDTDGDGIRDPGETGAGNVFLRAETNSSGDSQTGQTANNGTFRFAVEADEELTLSILLSTGLLSPADQGGDDSLDSDFDPTTNTLSISPINEGETLENIGAGLLDINNGLQCEPIIPDFISCEGSIVSLGVEALEGTPPYSYQWSNGASGAFTDISFSGIYSVTVTDVDLNTCVAEVPYNYLETFAPNLNITNAGCGLNGSVEVINPQDYSEIIWSTGDTGPILSDLPPGPYSFEYIDLTGCNGSEVFEIGNFDTRIGNLVWVDVPGGSDGQYDGGDKSLEGVEINLWEVSSNSIVKSTISDDNGNYFLTGDYTGEYFVEFILPQGYEFLEQADIADMDSTVLSKVNPSTGYTFIYIFECGDVNLTLDAGVREL